MPSDANGVYSLPDGYLAITGETIQASQHNPPLEDIATAMTARLTRSGAAPMTGPLKVVDGSAGSPSVQFSNAASTGFYKTTNGIGVSVGGTKVAEFGAGGMISGARWIGELVPFTGLTAPALTVFPQGQTLSRTTYAALWAFAQTEIAAGNTFYNNGDGSTTFGVGDLRGRVPAGMDPSGSILTSFSISPNANTLGATGGTQAHVLTEAELAPHLHNSGISDPGHAHDMNGLSGGSQVQIASQGGPPVLQSSGSTVTKSATTGITLNNASAGSGNGHNNVQPTIITNYVLFAGA